VHRCALSALPCRHILHVSLTILMLIAHLQTLEFNHRNSSVCWLYHLIQTVVLRCALVTDLTVSWDLPPPTMFSLNSKHVISVF